ncbi:MAG: PASTA domain-containing protein [Pseudomonadota bacterium]
MTAVKRWLQLPLLLCLAVLAGCSSGDDAQTPPALDNSTTTPSTAGVSQAAAEQAIRDAGLNVGTITSEPSDTVPNGDVIRTDPPAGNTITLGSTVNIIVSSGSADVQVPVTSGGTQSAAEAAITGAGLVVGMIDTESSDTVPAMQVIRTVPAGGSDVARGSEVDIVVSTGPADVSVPAVVNLPEMTAENDITGAGLIVGNVTRTADDMVPAGSVIAQSPVAGVMVSAGAAVDLVVSLGPANVMTPDTVGLTEAAARVAITDAGLVVGDVTSRADINVPAGEVISQTPDAGTLVALTSPVDLVVSLGPTSIPVPDIVGLTETEARAVIPNAGLDVGVVTEVFNNQIPAGDVISQSLAPGTEVLPDTALDFVVSLGPPVSTPNVVGLTRAAAEAAIVAANLVVGDVVEQNDFNVPAGDVISQDPTAGTQVPEQTAVDLVVSLGPPMVATPNVVGQTQAQAESAITAVGLVVGTVTRQNSASVPAGSVISQNPTATTMAIVGSAVNLTVSDGPPTVSVPDVTRQVQAQAESTITGAGLNVGTVSQQSSASVPAGSVISQNPIGGVSVTVGSNVDLVISSGPVTVVVPDVVGMTQAAATSDITNAGLVVGTVTQQTSAGVPDGSVISQNPTSGTTVNEGSSVDLVISSGPASVVVPDVVGMTQAAASSDITNAGLVVGTVTQQASASVPDGSVISQNPAGGASVADGSSVDLVVSSGPATDTFSDTFDTNSIADWTLRHQAEGTAAQYTVLDINVTNPGQLTVVPTQTPGWFDDDDAPLIFKLITGNFAVHTSVEADSVSTPGQAPSSNFNTAGLMARNPTGASGDENYIMLNVGRQNGSITGGVGSETKTTVNSNSTLFLDSGANQGQLILCRVGNEFISYRFLSGDVGWTETDRFTRNDLPATLQVGMIVNAFNAPADLRATFDFITLRATPASDADCTP